MKSKPSFCQRTSLVFFGLLLAFLILEAGLRLAGFALTALQEDRNRIALKKGGDYRVLCLGESTTQGQYPPFLEARLNQNDRGLKFIVLDQGKGGTDTTAILNRAEAYLDQYHPDMVVAMMGINDGVVAHLPYEDPSASAMVLFLKSFKTYKLARLLWLQITTKAKLPVISQARDKQPSPAGGLKNETHDEAAIPKELKKALELDPKDARAYVKLGKFYREQGAWARAEANFKKALALDPRYEPAYVELGSAYQWQGQFAQAEASFKKVLELNPRSDSAYQGLGNCYKAEGDLARAEASLKKAEELNPGDEQVYLALGNVYQQQGRLAQAEASLKKAQELNPKDERACVELGRFYREQEELTQAEGSFKKALELNPRDERLYVELGSFYQQLGQLARAEDSFKKALALDPRDEQSYVELGSVYQRRGQLAQAEASFKKAQKLNPGHGQVYLKLGSVYQYQGKLKQAEASFKKAQELNPGHELERFYQDEAEFTQAEAGFKKAHEFNPKDEQAYVELGRAYLQHEQFARGETSLKKVLELDPGNEWAYQGLGDYYQTEGRPAQAEASFKKVLELNPRNEAAYIALGKIFRQQRQFKQAERWLRKGLDLLGSRASLKLYGELAAISEGSGQAAHAQEYYRKASQLVMDGLGRNDTPTARNYRALKDMLDKRKIRLVCVQYPLRPIASLKNIFAGETDDIIFVDNENIFRDAIGRNGLNAYFRDMFGGNFGHCTDRGNKLLGDNIAQAIMRELFGR